MRRAGVSETHPLQQGREGADTLRPGNSRDSFQKRFARGSDRFANQAEDFDIGEAPQEKCFPCHQSAKDRDYVFTHYALTP